MKNFTTQNTSVFTLNTPLWMFVYSKFLSGLKCAQSEYRVLPEGFWDFFTKISDSVMQKIDKMP